MQIQASNDITSRQIDSQTMSTQSQESQPAQKGLIRTARLVPYKTVVWIQGTIIWMGDEQIAIDDGTGVARVHILGYERRDVAAALDKLEVGKYVMAVGELYKKFRGHRMGMKASTIRDLSSHGPLVESLWNLEVVDAFLHKKHSC